MENITKIIPMWAYPETLENYTETNCYVTWKSDNYLWNEDTFKEWKALILWKQLEIEWWKYIFPRYIGKIKLFWLAKVAYNQETEEFDIIKTNKLYIDNKEIEETNIDEFFDLKSKDKLKKCLLNQHKYYHSEETKERWSKERDYLFIQAKKVLSYTNDIIYKAKQTHNVNIWFDSEWNIQDNLETKRYFQFLNWIIYDNKTESFKKDGKEVTFNSYDVKKKKIIKFLFDNFPRRVTWEELCNALWLKQSSDRNKKLLDIKRSLIDVEFWNYLNVDKKSVANYMLFSERGQWYSLLWDFVSKI